MHFDFLALVVGSGPTYRNTPFYGELGTELKRRGYSVGFITTSRFADKVEASYGHTYFNLYDLADELKSKRTISYAEEGARIEQTYNINIRNYCLAEAMLEMPHSKNERELSNEVIEDFILIEDFLDKHKVGCFIQNQGGEIIRRVLTQVGKQRNIPSVWINFSPIKGFMSLHSRELDEWDNLKEIKPFKELEPEEIKEAESYITSFRDTREMYLGPSAEFDLLAAILSTSAIFGKLRQKYMVNKGQEPRKVIAYHFLIFKQGFKKLLYDISLSKNINRNEKFFFFPLHLPRESQLTIRAPQCLNQEDIVDIVARSLPYGYKLYTKEHPNHVGEVPFRAIRQISKAKDVVLLHPRTHSHDLIRNSAGVVAINSTVGFEAILYQKPAVILGKPFYSGLGLTIDVDNYFYIPDALREALRLKEIPYEKVISFTSAILKQSYKGRYGDSSEQNIRAVADSILSFLEVTSSDKRLS